MNLFTKDKSYYMDIKITNMFILKPIKSLDFAYVLAIVLGIAVSLVHSIDPQLTINQTIVDCIEDSVPVHGFRQDALGVHEHKAEANPNQMGFVGPVNNKLTTKEVRLSELIPNNPKAKYTKKEVLDFLANGLFLERAVLASKETTIPVSVLVAQTILESDLGNSGLTKATGNMGNIKCLCNRNPELRALHDKSNSQGTIVCVQGYDKIEKSNDWYEVIPSGWKDWRRRIEILSRYKVVRRAKGKNYGWEDWTNILHKSPYATDTNYQSKLDSIIKAYSLYNLDDSVDKRIVSDNGVYTFWDPSKFSN